MITSGQLKTITDFRNSPGVLLDQVKRASQPIGILRRNRLEAEDVLDRQIVGGRLRAAKKTDFVPYRQ